MKKLFLFLFIFLALKLDAAPVDEHGFLQAKNSFIYDETNKIFQLKGVSTHGLQWFADDITFESLKRLRDEWGINVIRAAMYTDQNGYISDKNLKFKVWNIVFWGIELGIYIIIDWHILFDGNPQKFESESIDFFSEASRKFAQYPNVIYEICNEPNGKITWQDNIKPYAYNVIRAIRKNDKKNLIIVGTNIWSSQIQEPANNPIYDRNTAYALHFYSGTATQAMRDSIDYARSRGISIVVTEWGVTDATGNGKVYFDESRILIDFLNARKIGHMAWSYSRANETSAMLMPNGIISETGLFIKQVLYK